MDPDFEAIEARRTALGVSQSELCQKADVHASTYYKQLHQRQNKPSARTLRRLRNALMAMELEAEAFNAHDVACQGDAP